MSYRSVGYADEVVKVVLCVEGPELSYRSVGNADEVVARGGFVARSVFV